MRAYVFIASALLACSAFLPWLAMRPMLGGEPILLSPWTFVEPMIDPPRGSRPPEFFQFPAIMWLFFASFLVAVVVGLLALADMARRWSILLAGMIPFIVVAWAIGGILVEIDRSGVPTRDLVDGARMLGIDARSVETLISELSKVLGVGFYLHYVSALALVVVGFVVPDRTVTA